MKAIYRILDASFNRSREALRVLEDCGRFALNDPAITAMAKTMRSELAEAICALPQQELIASRRDTAGDIGTELTSPMENKREDLADVAVAASRRLTEALRNHRGILQDSLPRAGRGQIERMRYNGYTLEQRVMGRLYVAPAFPRCETVRADNLHHVQGLGTRGTARLAVAVWSRRDPAPRKGRPGCRTPRPWPPRCANWPTRPAAC